MTEPAPKIIVDDDWKSQVEREKARAQQEDEAARPPDGDAPFPEASFPVLVSMLATQALLGMGQIPDPFSGQAVIHRDSAKHFIDLLSMLEQKTAGQLTAPEREMLSEVLHQLRMLYVSLPAGAAAEPPPQGSIELP